MADLNNTIIHGSLRVANKLYSNAISTNLLSSNSIEENGVLLSDKYLSKKGGRILFDQNHYIDILKNEIIISGLCDPNGVLEQKHVNPKLTFRDHNYQGVSLTYTDYDNYRAPAGLKVVGNGSDSGPAWFEVEGDIIGDSNITSKKDINAFGYIRTNEKIISQAAVLTNITSRLSSLNLNHIHNNVSGQPTTRIDITNKTNITDKSNPPSDGFVQTYFWDNDYAYDSQVFIPCTSNNHLRFRTRAAMDAWPDKWQDIAYLDDIFKDNIFFHPEGGIYLGEGVKTIGAIKITLPKSWSNTMIRFNVDIYNYSFPNSTATYVIGGYTYESGQWINQSAMCLSADNSSFANLPVRFGNDVDKCVVYIGDVTTEWTYPQIFITNVLPGRVSQNRNYSEWNKNWKIEVVQEITATKLSKVESKLFASNSGTAENAKNVTGIVNIAHGGTSSTTAPAAISNLISNCIYNEKRMPKDEDLTTTTDGKGSSWKYTLKQYWNSWIKPKVIDTEIKQSDKARILAGPNTDTRTVVNIPNKYFNEETTSAKSKIQTDFKTIGATGIKVLNGSGDDYCQLLTFTPWTDKSGGYPMQMAMNYKTPDTFAFRTSNSDGTAWHSWTSFVNTTTDQNIAGKKIFQAPIVVTPGSPIQFKGTQNIYNMIEFIDNKLDGNGNGIKIGGGGKTVIGGGESADLFKSETGGSEVMIISNDNDIDFYSNCQDGASHAKNMKLDRTGNLRVPEAISISNQSATMKYDSTNKCIKFIFA